MKLKLMLPTAAILLCTFGSQTLAAAPVVVACGSGNHAIVRDTFVRGQAVTQVECVRGSAYRSIVSRTHDAGRYRAARRHRSWGKAALVIGGSAATGAGIGGLVHGKKGALIGGALGGGVASLYEGARRR
jgi:hypothetical protein